MECYCIEICLKTIVFDSNIKEIVNKYQYRERYGNGLLVGMSKFVEFNNRVLGTYTREYLEDTSTF